MTCRIGLKAAGFAVAILLLALAGCQNALVEAAKAIQAETVTPVISVKLADGTTLNSGGTVDFGVIAINETVDVELTIANGGKSALSIADGAVSIGDAAPFSVSRQPTDGIPVGGSDTVGIHLSGETAVNATRTLTITSNDVNTPRFTLKLVAIVSAYSRPEAPANLSVTNPGGTPADWTQLVLTWSEVTPATDYEVQRDVSQYGNYATKFQVSGSTTTSYTDTSCVPGTVYWYRIKTINHDLYSTFTSQTISWQTLGTPVTSLSVTPSSATMYFLGANGTQTLTPNVSAGASIPAVAWSSSDPLIATVNSGGVVTAVAGGSASITAMSTDNTGISGACNITVSAPAITASGITASNAASASVNLPWTAVAGADHYDIYRSTSPGVLGGKINGSNITTSNYIDSTATNWTTYYYTLMAVNAAGAESLESEQVIITPAHQVLYLANFGDYMDYDLIDPYAWTKSPVGTGIVGSGPSCTAVDASGKFLYESNAGPITSALGVDGYAINQTSGSLGFINGVYTGALTEGLVVASPNGPAGQQFVYCTFRSVGQVGSFAINNTTGALSYLPIGSALPQTLVYHSDGAGGSGNPRWLSVNPSGKNLYVSNSNSNKISMFSIDAATGVLTFAESYTTGDYPYKSAVSADGKYLYVVNVNGDSVSAFSIDEADGTLMNVGTYATGDNPTCVAIAPSSRYAYVTNGSGNTITAYSISNGALTPINGDLSSSSSATWVYPNSVAVDLTGTHLVVANSNSTNASVYAIAAETGALTIKLNFPTGLYPTHVAFQRLP